jgi:hypothetical protein
MWLLATSLEYFCRRRSAPPELHIDELYLNYSFAGSRMPRNLFSHQGLEVGRQLIRTPMRRIGIEATIADAKL